MPEQTRTPVFIDGLYEKLVEGGINYFFPAATLQVIDAGVEPIRTAGSSGTYKRQNTYALGAARIFAC